MIRNFTSRYISKRNETYFHPKTCLQLFAATLLIVAKWKGFPGGSAGRESACSVGDLGSIPGLGRSPGEGEGHPLQFSGLENSVDSTVHGVAKSQTPLSNTHFTSTSGNHQNAHKLMNEEMKSDMTYNGKLGSLGKEEQGLPWWSSG